MNAPKKEMYISSNTLYVYIIKHCMYTLLYNIHCMYKFSLWHRSRILSAAEGRG